MGEKGECGKIIRLNPGAVNATAYTCFSPKLRMHFHLFMTALMDEETQKKGAISVVHSLNSAAFSNSKCRDPMLIWESIELVLKALPIRFVGIHICANPSSIGGKIFSSMARFLGEKGLVRVRFHQGKKMNGSENVVCAS